MKPKTPIQKLLAEDEASTTSEPSVIVFNSSATVQQKLAVISQKFQGFAQTLVEEKTKKLNSTVV